MFMNYFAEGGLIPLRLEAQVGPRVAPTLCQSKCNMTFEKKSLCVVIPLDLVEGSHYIEPVRNYESDDDLDCIYKITV